MKINNNYKFSSIWDELPEKSPLKNKKIPENISEALELTQAAQKSIDSSVMKTWDAHNDMMKKSAELRKFKHQKDLIEQKNIQHRQEQRDLMNEIALKRLNNQKLLEQKLNENTK